MITVVTLVRVGLPLAVRIPVCEVEVEVVIVVFGYVGAVVFDGGMMVELVRG